MKDAHMLLTYLVALLITFMGMLQQLSPFATIPLGACLFSILAIGERHGLLASQSGIASEQDEPYATMADLLTSSAAALAAFLLGRATAWLWGI